MRAALKTLTDRWRAAEAERAAQAERDGAVRCATSQTVAKRAANAALDAARALEQGELAEACELLDRARRDARDARTLAREHVPGGLAEW